MLIAILISTKALLQFFYLNELNFSAANQWLVLGLNWIVEDLNNASKMAVGFGVSVALVHCHLDHCSTKALFWYLLLNPMEFQSNKSMACYVVQVDV